MCFKFWRFETSKMEVLKHFYRNVPGSYIATVKMWWMQIIVFTLFGRTVYVLM